MLRYVAYMAVYRQVYPLLLLDSISNILLFLLLLPSLERLVPQPDGNQANFLLFSGSIALCPPKTSQKQNKKRDREAKLLDCVVKVSLCLTVPPPKPSPHFPFPAAVPLLPSPLVFLLHLKKSFLNPTFTRKHLITGGHFCHNLQSSH